jgi:hypothetical protein
MSCKLVAVATLLVASSASAARIAVVVESAGDRSGEVATALKARVVGTGDEAVEAPAADVLLDDAALTQLRDKLGAARVVVATVQRQGKDRWLVSLRAADAGGIARRFGEATGATLVEVVVAKAGDLPPLAPPAPPAAAAAPAAGAPAAADTTPAAAATPTAAADSEAPPAAAPPASPTPSDSHRRKHEYGLLIGGIVAFLVPWLATVGFAAHYLDYNPNAARLGFAPLVGPLLAKQKINDKDLGDGYDVGLSVDGAIEIIGTTVLIAGILYAAIGVPAKSEHAALSKWRPLVAAGPRGGQLGAEVSW